MLFFFVFQNQKKESNLFFYFQFFLKKYFLKFYFYFFEKYLKFFYIKKYKLYIFFIFTIFQKINNSSSTKRLPCHWKLPACLAGREIRGHAQFMVPAKNYL